MTDPRSIRLAEPSARAGRLDAIPTCRRPRRPARSRRLRRALPPIPRRVYSYAFYQLGDHHEAEDATERTFLSALSRSTASPMRAPPSRRGCSGSRTTPSRTPTGHAIGGARSRWPGSVGTRPGADPAVVLARADEGRAVRAAGLHPRRPAAGDHPPLRRRPVGPEIGAVLDRSEGAARVCSIARCATSLASSTPAGTRNESRPAVLAAADDHPPGQRSDRRAADRPCRHGPARR